MAIEDRSIHMAAAGELDPAFANNGIYAIPTSRGSIRSIVIDEQGAMLLAVWVTSRIWIYRVLPDATLDPQFGRNGVIEWEFITGVDSLPARLMLQADGKIVVIGQVGLDPFRRETALTRFNPSGSPDLIFGNKIISGANAWGPTGCLQADGKILVLVHRSDPQNQRTTELHRLLANGEVDLAFGGQGFIEVRFNDARSEGAAVAVTDDGKILVGGTVRREGENPWTQAVARYFPGGGLDASFGRAGYWESEHNYTMENMSVDANAIVCIGHGVSNAGLRVACISRLTADGLDDPTFNDGRTVVVDIPSQVPGYEVNCRSVAIQADNSVVVGGLVGPYPNAYWLRLLPDGRLDSDFADQGIKVYERPSLLYDLQILANQQRLLAAVDDNDPRKPYVLGIQLQ
jgi:uncharacterized delta-60 repeat protein